MSQVLPVLEESCAVQVITVLSSNRICSASSSNYYYGVINGRAQYMFDVNDQCSTPTFILHALPSPSPRSHALT